MATTENTFTGNGTLNSFAFTFPIIKRDDVKVSLNDTLIASTEYTFTNDTTIVFNAISPATTLQETSGAPKSGVAVRVYRETDVDDPVASFFAGSAIRAQDLNDNFLQVIYRSQEDENNNWNNNTETIKSNETWDSSDTKIATTAAMDARFQDEATETIESGETWVSDNNSIATTAAIDARFFNDTTETIQSGEAWPNNDTTIATTAAIDDAIDAAITGDIAGSDGVSITDDGDGTITVGLTAGAVDLDRIKAADIIVEAEANPDNDTTIATTAKITDMIDDAITGDIATDNTGITVTDDGDGTITLGLANIDLDRIKADDIVTLAEQNAGPTADDDSIFTTSAAARRFDTIVQTSTPAGSVWETGKTWLQNDDDQTLKIWNGSTWLDVASGGSFRTQDKVIYVDATGGDDAKTGHRISGPKLTIKGAIADINADISLSTETSDGFAGGTGYGEGSYSSVPLTHFSGTGIGTGVTADITVNASGVVTGVTINTASDLEEYSIGDVLTAADANLGNLGTGSGLRIPIIGGGDGMTVIVAAGVYQEAAPIQIKRRNVSIVGMALRSTLVHPTVATQGDQSAGNHALFELNSGSFIQNLTLTGMKANNSGTNTLDSALPDRQGWNFAFFDGCFIEKSPYIQNCTNFSDSEIDNSDLRAHRPRGGGAGDTDSLPTGGGLLVDGSVPATTSPIRSMVADSYTHVGLNGPGILVTNNGYTQITSSYAFFNKYHIKALNGGQANLAASTSDFGERSLIADGKSTAAIFTATVNGLASDGDLTFDIDNVTASAGWFGADTKPASNMLVTVNSVTYPILSSTAISGGHRVTISRPNPSKRSENLGLDGNVADNAAVSFFLRSQIASSGHTMEYVGSGTNYNALPENGGVPDETKQITESNNGKIWTAITDHNGKFKIGGNQTDDPIFEVDQQLGFITIPTGSISFDLLSDTTPQLGGNLDVNSKTITSTSGANVVIDPDGSGTVDVSTSRITNVDTPSDASDAATKGYVDSNFVADAGGTMSGALAMGSNKITGLGTPTDNADAATKAYVDGQSTVVVNDTTPQLGGNLDVNGNEITSVSNGDIVINPNGSGKVGIGTNSPLHKLHLKGTDNSDTGDVTLRVDAGTASSGSATNDAVLDLTSRGNTSGGFGRTQNCEIRSIGQVTTGGVLTFHTDDTNVVMRERMRIDSSGNVGIGTSSPGNKFVVKAAPSGDGLGIIKAADGSTVSATIEATRASTDSVSIKAFEATTNDGNCFNVNYAGGAYFKGDVGIGTSSPDGELHIRAGTSTSTTFFGDSTLCVENSASGNYIHLGGPNTQAQALYFGDADDPDVGGIVYSHSSNYISFRANGSQRMIIDSNGYAGIGTNIPETRLTVSRLGSNWTGADPVAGTAAFIHSGVSSASSPTSPAYISISSGTSSNNGVYFGDDDDADVGGLIYNHSLNSMNFLVNAGTRMLIDSVGTLVMGTTARLTNLRDRQTIYDRQAIAQFVGTASTNASTACVSYNASTSLFYAPHIWLAKSHNATKGVNGIVSLGEELGVINFAGNDGSSFINAASIHAGVDATPGSEDMPGYLIFSTTADGANIPTERMQINSKGQVGMGTNGIAVASAATDVTIRMTPATSAYGLYSSNFSSGSTSTPGGYGVYGHMGGLPPSGAAHYGVYGRVDTNSLRASGGILGYSINTNIFGILGYWSTAAYYGLYTNGAVYAASGYSSSDARLKDIVSDGIGTGILDKVCQLQAKRFTWKENTQQRRACENVQIGLLAQDVQIDFPEVVESVKQTKITGVNPETLNEQLGDNLAVDYGKLVPVLVEALKEAKERIETLETKVAALEAV